MVRKTLAIILGAALLALMATGAFALEVPPYSGHVNDLANMMSPAARRALETQLAELDKTDSTQVAVLTIPSLDGDSMQDFSIRVADAWKVGQKGSDNGVILLVSKDDRKTRIEVGYGLEGVLTDVLAGQIIDRIINPRFKSGDFDGGFLQGATAITKAVRGEYAASAKQTRRGKRGVLSLIIIPMILFIAMTEMFGKRRRAGRISDGRIVDGRHSHRSGMGSAATTLFFLSMLGGGRGGGGGFGDGGGFGGFGGGGFGGGGAGGDW